ncbi:hypothetical protein ACIOTI_38280 [Streptomyces sp. NPDC087843]|uniref:hypothetical protein n=1 Tax=Streptomyces sp. NPDC087843 TaxID=3365804 RepID=UPI00382FDDDE
MRDRPLDALLTVLLGSTVCLVDVRQAMTPSRGRWSRSPSLGRWRGGVTNDSTDAVTSRI